MSLTANEFPNLGLLKRMSKWKYFSTHTRVNVHMSCCNKCMISHLAADTDEVV